MHMYMYNVQQSQFLFEEQLHCTCTCTCIYVHANLAVLIFVSGNDDKETIREPDHNVSTAIAENIHCNIDIVTSSTYSLYRYM